MKKIIAYSFNLLFLVTFLASCLGDLDTCHWIITS